MPHTLEQWGIALAFGTLALGAIVRHAWRRARGAKADDSYVQESEREE